MNPLYVYPGSFSPPTYGHFYIVKQVAAVAPQVVIICSTNSDKDRLFSEEESCQLWQAYDLPLNVRVATFAAFAAEKNNPKSLIMVRGIRNSQDFDYEKKVAFQNRQDFGISQFFYIMSNQKNEDISSSAARLSATELRLTDLSHYVAPQVATALLEKVLHIKNLVLVVGRPGSGKSTFLRRLMEIAPATHHINTDDFNHKLQPLLRRLFKEEDLTKVALNKERELRAALAKPWMKMLSAALRQSPPDSHVFVEIPYAFKPGMDLYKLLGGKTLYFDCGDVSENARRLEKRGTPHLNQFITTIPDWPATKRLSDEEKLDIGRIDTSGTLADMEEMVQCLAEKLNQSLPLFPFSENGSADWSLTEERVMETFRSIGLSYSNRRHLVRFGDQNEPYRRRPMFSMHDRQHIRNALD